jgi:hypothetical protein
MNSASCKTLNEYTAFDLASLLMSKGLLQEIKGKK